MELGWRPAEMARLLKVLPYFRNLQKLDLSKNENLGSQGAQILLAGLRIFSSLAGVFLIINDCRFSRKAKADLRKAWVDLGLDTERLTL